MSYGPRLCGNCFHEVPAEAAFCPDCGHSLAVDESLSALPIGTMLSNSYLVGRVLGRGGFGITYKVLHRDGRIMALKEYYPQMICRRADDHATVVPTSAGAEDFEWGRRRFLVEADTLGKLGDVQGIAHVIESLEANGTSYFSMDYVEGTDLEHYVRQHGERLTWAQLRTILYPVIDALISVHAKKLVHRDISPDNICVTRDGTGVLLDFGAARYDLGDRTQTVSVILKRSYAPIEQYYEHSDIGPFTDVYALGGTIYRCLTGHAPVSSMERLGAQTGGRPDPLRPPSTYVSLPRGLELAIMEAMALKPKARFQSMQAFRNALDSAVRPKPKPRPKPQQPQSQPEPQPEPKPEPKPHPKPKQKSGSRPGLTRRLFLGLAGAVAAYAIGYSASKVLLGSDSDGDPTDTEDDTTGDDGLAGFSGITQAVASSTLDPYESNTYDASNVLDGNPSTCWSEGAAGDGVGEYITLSGSAVQTFSGFSITNGYQKSNEIYYENPRPTAIDVLVDGDKVMSITLADVYGMTYNYSLTTPMDGTSITFLITSVAEGNTYSDCCISDIDVF